MTNTQSQSNEAKCTIIPAGYRFIFDSWENDGDYKRTVVTEGVSEPEARLLAEIAKTLVSGGTGLENNYEPDDKEVKKGLKVLMAIFERFQTVFSEEDFDAFRIDGSLMADYIADKILGYSAEGYYFRVLDAYKIEHVPFDILIKDVTDQF
jgi:hypothetical protein